MSPDEIGQLTAARESLCRRRGELSKQIGSASRVSIEAAEKLTKVLQAIEAVDRALNEAGQPYMSASVRDAGLSPAPGAPQPAKPRSKGKAEPKSRAELNSKAEPKSRAEPKRRAEPKSKTEPKSRG